MYAEAFEQLGVLDKLEGFASRNGPKFYGLPINSEKIRLTRKSWTLPESMPLEESQIVPFRAGETLSWKASRV